MNKYFSKMLVPLAFMLGVLGFTSCTDYLNKSPLSDIAPTTAFKNYQNFQGFTDELYNCIPLMTAVGSHNNWNFGDDEIWEADNRLFANSVDQGNYWDWNTAGFGSWFKTGGDPSNTANNNKGSLWGLSWYGIRKANIGLANIDLLVDATDEQKQLIKGQLYFFRGWFHFMLMQYWGGLPYINMVLPADQAPRLPRLSYQATADSVAADLKRAADLLPVDWDKTTTGAGLPNTPRINKIMALGFLGKNYLWAGSPLMNYESTGSKTYNAAYCKKAADAFAEVLQLSQNTICSDGSPRYSLAPFSGYQQLFRTYNAGGRLPGVIAVADGNGGTNVYREAIFYESLASASGSRWRWNQVNDYRPPIINNSGIKCWPTANYVDYFGMANGLPIADPTKKDPISGYDPEYPWVGRDPRFYADIIFDGIQCAKKFPSDKTKQYASLYFDPQATKQTPGYGSSTGTYRFPVAQKVCLTGYMNCKFTDQFTNDNDGYLDNNCVVLCFMRLADVYLMYAEATAMGYGTPQSKANTYTAGVYSLSAVDAVNKIRDRVKPDGSMRLDPKYTLSNDVFMPELRRERAVELAFEGHRFVDLRRWLLLTEKPYTLKTTVYFDRATDVTDDQRYADPINKGHVKNFREVVLLERQFAQKHYWFPLLQNDANIYIGFSQNPGW